MNRASDERSQGMSMFCGICDAHGTDRAQPLEQRGPLGGRLHVRGQRARDRRRCTIQEDHQLAADVESCEVVVMGLGDRQAMAGEDQGGLELAGPARPAS